MFPELGKKQKIKTFPYLNNIPRFKLKNPHLYGDSTSQNDKSMLRYALTFLAAPVNVAA